MYMFYVIRSFIVSVRLSCRKVKNIIVSFLGRLFNHSFVTYRVMSIIIASNCVKTFPCSPFRYLAKFIGLDKRVYQVNIFLFLHENVCCGYLMSTTIYVFMEK